MFSIRLVFPAPNTEYRKLTTPLQGTLKTHTRLPYISAIVLLILAVLLPNRVWMILLVAIVGLTAVSWAWVRLLREGLSASRELRFRLIAVGDTVEEMFLLENSSAVPAIQVEVLDQSNVPGYRPSSVRSVPNTGFARWRERAVCERRGRYQVGPWSIRTGDPFGLFETELFFAEQQEMIVHPPIHTDLPVALPSGFGSGQSRRQRRSFQAEINADGVRQYRPNDPLHHIHWKSTARHGELNTRLFERDTSGDVWLLLDMDSAVQVGDGLESTEEQAVLLAASLAAQSLFDDRAIGLAAYGSTPVLIPPARGEGQRGRILRALAMVSADSNTTLSRAIHDLVTIVARGSAVLIFTPNLNAEWIPDLLEFSQRGIGVSVALFDRSTFGGTATPKTLFDPLTRLNISFTTLQNGDTGRPTTPEALQDEFVITPHGAVIRRKRT